MNNALRESEKEWRDKTKHWKTSRWWNYCAVYCTSWLENIMDKIGRAVGGIIRNSWADSSCSVVLNPSKRGSTMRFLTPARYVAAECAENVFGTELQLLFENSRYMMKWYFTAMTDVDFKNDFLRGPFTYLITSGRAFESDFWSCSNRRENNCTSCWYWRENESVTGLKVQGIFLNKL